MADATRAIRLQIEDQDWDYWQGVSVGLSMESLSGSFELDISFDSDENAPWPIPKGAKCVVLAYDQPVITGFVDAVNPQYSKSDCGISVSGRDAAADLVDCTAIRSKSQWQYAKVETIVARFAGTLWVNRDSGGGYR